MELVVVYKTVNRVFYAVAKQDIGCIKSGVAVIGVQASTRKECELKLSDWCANENVSRKKLKIYSGFLPGEVTNHKEYAKLKWLNV